MININENHEILIDSEEQLRIWNDILSNYNVEWRFFASAFEKKLVISCAGWVWKMIEEDVYAVH